MGLDQVNLRRKERWCSKRSERHGRGAEEGPRRDGFLDGRVHGSCGAVEGEEAGEEVGQAWRLGTTFKAVGVQAGSQLVSDRGQSIP